MKLVVLSALMVALAISREMTPQVEQGVDAPRDRLAGESVLDEEELRQRFEDEFGGVTLLQITGLHPATTDLSTGPVLGNDALESLAQKVLLGESKQEEAGGGAASAFENANKPNEEENKPPEEQTQKKEK